MGKKTPFYASHVTANAKIVDFAGWDMPLHYGSQLEEHHCVRNAQGMFDVSHMGVIDLHGPNVESDLKTLLANNVERLSIGKALYSCMLNEAGGIIDDLIVYKIENDFFRVVVNAGTKDKDLAWIEAHLSADTVLTLRNDQVILAIQGPQALNSLQKFLPVNTTEQLQQLKPFHFFQHEDLFIARTGYTGEDGVELIFDAAKATERWQSFLALGIKPCGLGARDTLRLEAGLNLYGADMDETVTPYESNLGWTVVLNPETRRFIGRDALENQKASGVPQKLIGLVLEGPGIIRNHQKVVADELVGEVTSGGYSPTLERSIALARVPQQFETNCTIDIRGKQIPARVVKPPFVRQGKKLATEAGS